MLEQSFIEDGIKCELYRHSEREYEIIVYYEDKPKQKLSQKYTCQYPALFGIDVIDNYELERIIDNLISKIK